MTRAEILLHIVNHTSYHRGFVADLFYQVPGARPPTTDLPVYLREAAAAPAKAVSASPPRSRFLRFSLGALLGRGLGARRDGALPHVFLHGYATRALRSHPHSH